MSKNDMRDLLHELADLGVEVTLTGGKHYKALTPQGPVFFPSTPSDRRGVLNTRAELRRHGVPLPRSGGR